MGEAVCHHERNGLAFRDLELADSRQILSLQRHRCVKHHHVRPGNRSEGSVGQPADPGDGPSVVEPQHEFRVHLDAAAIASHQPDHVGVLASRRHEIDEGDDALTGLHRGFEDQGVIAIAARDARGLARGRNQPATVFRSTQQRRKACARIEPRPTQPVDRAAARDECSGLTVAEEGVVFESVAQSRIGNNAAVRRWRPERRKARSRA